VARGTGPLFSVFGALLILGEKPSLVGWLGIATIFFGIVFVAGGRKVFSRAKTSGVASGLRWGAITGLCIALYTIVDGWAVKTLTAPPVAYYALGLVFRTVLLAPFALRGLPALKTEWRAHAPHIVAVGILSPLAYGLVLTAMTLAPLSYVAPMRELSLMIAALLGAGVLKEDDAKSRIAGSALMAAGVVVIALA
jgi:drug/metabolite transporter (DMT)-like permease